MTKEEMDDHEYERVLVEDLTPREEVIDSTSSWSQESDNNSKATNDELKTGKDNSGNLSKEEDSQPKIGLEKVSIGFSK